MNYDESYEYFETAPNASHSSEPVVGGFYRNWLTRWVYGYDRGADQIPAMCLPKGSIVVLVKANNSECALLFGERLVSVYRQELKDYFTLVRPKANRRAK